MPKGYVVVPDDEEEGEEIAEIESGLLHSDQETETGASKRLIF